MSAARRALKAFCTLVPLIAGCAHRAPSQSGSASTQAPALRDVLLVGNSVAGTVSIIDGSTFQLLGSINAVPDLSSRMEAIESDPIHYGAFLLLTKAEKLSLFEPADGQRFIDDVLLSPDGLTLYVSRGNLGDMIAFDLSDASYPIVWRTDIPGFHSDHAALSPDGTRLVVSATSLDVAEVLDAHSGVIVGSFPTGHFPHQNDYSADGQRIYNGSIGDVLLPSVLDGLKGARELVVVDANTLNVLNVYTFPEGVRPTVITPDETMVYADQSYLNGLVKLDMATGNIISTLQSPLSDFAQANYVTEDDYPHNSAHHGLSLSGDGTQLCDVGTIDNTVSIVSTATMTVASTVDVGLSPYWATTSVDGTRCFVSVAGANSVAVVDFASGQIVTTVPVDAFPERNRLGKLPESVVAGLSTAPEATLEDAGIDDATFAEDATLEDSSVVVGDFLPRR